MASSSLFIDRQIMIDASEQGRRKGEDSVADIESRGETSSISKTKEDDFVINRNLRCNYHEANLLGTNDCYWKYTPLKKAALRGNWNTAKKFFEKDQNAITAPLTGELETALYMATGTGPIAVHFVVELLKLMPAEAVTQRDKAGNTPLHLGAWVGNTTVAVLLVEKNSELLRIRENRGWLPVHYAAINAKKDTLTYLLTETAKDAAALSMLFSTGSERSGAELLTHIITSEFYDVAFDLVHRYPQLARLHSRNDNECGLRAIARKVEAFPSGWRLNFWERILYSHVSVKLEKYAKDPDRIEIEDPAVNKSQLLVQKYDWACTSEKRFFISVPRLKHIRELKQMHLQALQLLKLLIQEMMSLYECGSLVTGAIVDATRLGIPEVVEEIVEAFPKLAWARDAEDRNLFQRAVIERQENIFNLIYQMTDHKESATMDVDESGDNILHLAGRLAPPNKLNLVSGAALQMQRELQWYKEVKNFVRPSYVEKRNKHNETPAMVFTKEHQALVVEGGKWMKETAESCTISAALIATVVFAAAITVPGGTNSSNGVPIFSKEMAFKIFFISDALSLFTSTTSLLVFLSILTSRCAEGDFLYVLPKRLIIGLVTLFLSITTMMVTFSMSLQLVLGQKKAWILVAVAALACMPVTSFVSLQFPLLADLISSTYGRGIFGKKNDRQFF